MLLRDELRNSHSHNHSLHASIFLNDYNIKHSRFIIVI